MNQQDQRTYTYGVDGKTVLLVRAHSDTPCRTVATALVEMGLLMCQEAGVSLDEVEGLVIERYGLGEDEAEDKKPE